MVEVGYWYGDYWYSGYWADGYWYHSPVVVVDVTEDIFRRVGISTELSMEVLDVEEINVQAGISTEVRQILDTGAQVVVKSEIDTSVSWEFERSIREKVER